MSLSKWSDSWALGKKKSEALKPVPMSRLGLWAARFTLTTEPGWLCGATSQLSVAGQGRGALIYRFPSLLAQARDLSGSINSSNFPFATWYGHVVGSLRVLGNCVLVTLCWGGLRVCTAGPQQHLLHPSNAVQEYLPTGHKGSFSWSRVTPWENHGLWNSSLELGWPNWPYHLLAGPPDELILLSLIYFHL